MIIYSEHLLVYIFYPKTEWNIIIYYFIVVYIAIHFSKHFLNIKMQTYTCIFSCDDKHYSESMKRYVIVYLLVYMFRLQF